MTSKTEHSPPRVPVLLTPEEALLRDQREANENLVLATMHARAEVEFGERLIGIIGHDLRNPLNTMLMAGGLLTARGRLVPEDARLAARIVNSGERMARMITQLASYTRARIGAPVQIDLAAADLGTICQDIADELRVSSSADIRVTLNGDLTGFWDAGRLGEVISNLTGNAIDHATAGTAVEIHVRDDEAGDLVLVDVTNCGAPIPVELLPFIFNAFRRAGGDDHSHAQSRGGHLGLGLFISCQIALAHGGSLVVRSSDGTTTFTLGLPRTAPPPGDATSSKPAALNPAA